MTGLIGPLRAAELANTCRVHYPYIVQANLIFSHLSMAEWCRERFGGEATATRKIGEGEEGTVYVGYFLDPTAAWARRFYTYFFRDPTHAFEFKMRWS